MYTVIHAIVGYFFLLLTVRVMTRRPGGQMTPFEFVIIFLIGGVIILSTVGNDRSVTNCTCAVITIGLMHRTVSWARARFPKFGAVIDGAPLLLMGNGQWRQEAMRQMKISPDDVMAAARTKGVSTFEGIKYAVLERNGSINIVKN